MAMGRQAVARLLCAAVAAVVVYAVTGAAGAGVTAAQLKSQDKQPRRAFLEASTFDASKGLQLSSHTCTNPEDPSVNICVYSNLVRWNNKLYYLTENGASISLPKAIINQKTEEEASDVIEVVPLQQLAAELHAAGQLQHVHYKYGFVWRPELFTNWWHTFDDITIMYWPWCQGLGHCNYSQSVVDESALLIFNPGYSLLGILHLWQAKGMPGFLQAFQCYGSRLLNIQNVSEPLVSNPVEAIPDTVFTFERVVAGKGTTTGHGWQAERLGVQPPTAAERLQVMAYVRECAGLPALPAVQRRPPNVVVLNRAYLAGRSMLRLDEVAFQVRRARPHANVTVQFLEGMDFREQAALFSVADVMVLSHGAACSNLFFLPLVAGVVHVSDSIAQKGFQDDILSQLPAPYDVTNIPYMHDTNLALEPVVAKLRRDEEFTKRETAQGKLDLILAEEDRPYRMLNRMANYLVDPEEMTPLIVNAIDDWQRRVEAKGGVTYYELSAVSDGPTPGTPAHSTERHRLADRRHKLRNSQ